MDIDIKKMERLIESIEPTNVAVVVKSVLIPPKIIEGDEWKESVPSFSDDLLKDGITIPLIIGNQLVYCDLNEAEESKFVEIIVDIMRNFSMQGRRVMVGPEDAKELEERLIDFNLDQQQFNLFKPLWEQEQAVCVEYRAYVGSMNDLRDVDKKKQIILPNLLFSVGGVWDEKSKSWMYEPFSQPQEIWA